MNPFSTYNRILTWPLAGLFLLLYGLACVVEPIDGDLTRLGAYWENDYGWNTTQRGFAKPVFDFNPEGTLDRYYDVVVIGDSFSIKNFPYQWQNFFVGYTGLSLLTLPVDKTNLAELIESPVFQNTPPRLVILETVERAVVSRLTADLEPGDECTRGSEPTMPTLALHPRILPMIPILRDRTVSPLTPNFNESAHTLKGTLKRWYDLGIKSRFGKLPQTVRLPLKSGGLFSSRVQDAILLYRQDFQKPRLTAEIRRRAFCGLFKWQRTVQANGRTRFAALVVPDKATAYEDFIEFGGRVSFNHAGFLNRDSRAPVVPLLSALKKAIDDGTETDVYMPNDTHWGEAGNRIAAETVLRYLKARAFIR